MIELARKKKFSNGMPTQTLTARAKIINLSDRDALLLGLLGFSATKLWNVANHHRRTVWNETGKIPGFAEQCRELKNNRWYRLLSSQSAQEVLGEQDDSYRSWFSHRKNGDVQARPPGFRKKDTLSTVAFKQNAFEILPDNRVRLKLPRTYGRREIILEYQLPPHVTPSKVQQVKLVYEPGTGDWYLHITHRVPVTYKETGNVMALDLGIVNIVAGLISDGFSFVDPAGNFWGITLNVKCRCNKILCKSSGF